MLALKPPRFAFLREVPVDVLGLEERLEPLLAQLARAAAELHPAERPGVVVGQRVVDPAGAGLDLFVVLLDRARVVAGQVRA